MRKRVLEASRKGVEEFLNSYKDKALKDQALEYVYEGDLQAGLYNSIKSSLENYQWNSGKKEWVVIENKKNYPKTNTPCLVHCEQTCKDKAIDIAVWDPTEKNVTEQYDRKDLLLLIEIKYVRTKSAIKETKDDYEKLRGLNLKKHQRGLVLTFTVPEIKENKKLLESGESIDTCGILKEKQTQALVAYRDKIIEILFQQENR